MQAYRTYVTVTDPKQIVITDAPFRTGEKVEVIVMITEDNPTEQVHELQALFNKTQALPQVQALTEDDILREIQAYRNGK